VKWKRFSRNKCAGIIMDGGVIGVGGGVIGAGAAIGGIAIGVADTGDHSPAKLPGQADTKGGGFYSAAL